MAAGVTVGSLKVALGLDDSGFDKASSTIKGKAAALGGSLASALGGATKLIGQAVVAGTLAVGAALAGFSVQAIGVASDVDESLSKVNVVFGESGAEIAAWSETTATSLGISQAAALDAVGIYGNLFTSMGIGKDAAADLSTNLVQTAADLASFNNQDPTEVLDKLRAGLTGETEPLKSLGINLNQAQVAAKALELGLVDLEVDSLKVKDANAKLTASQQKAADALAEHGAGSLEYSQALIDVEKKQVALEDALGGTVTEVDAAAKAQATYALILEQSANAQGDFERTSEGLANQQRILNANITDLTATFGEQLLPIAGQALGAINDLVTGLAPEFENLAGALGGLLSGQEGAAEEFAESAKAIVEGVAAALSEVLPVIVDVVSSILPVVIETIVTILPIVIETIVELLPIVVDSIAMLIPMLVDAILLLLPMLIGVIAEIVPQILETLLTALPMLVEAAVGVIVTLAMGIADMLPELIPVIVDVILQIVNVLIENLPLLIEAAMQIIIALTEGLILAIPVLLEGLPEIIDSLINFFTEQLPKLQEVGNNLIVGLWEGIKSLDLGTLIKEFADGVVSQFQEAFAINSPSDVMADEIGAFIPPGILKGAQKKMPNLARGISSMVGAAVGSIGVPAFPGGGSGRPGLATGGGVTLHITIENITIGNGVTSTQAAQVGKQIGESAALALARAKGLA